MNEYNWFTLALQHENIGQKRTNQAWANNRMKTKNEKNQLKMANVKWMEWDELKCLQNEGKNCRPDEMVISNADSLRKAMRKVAKVVPSLLLLRWLMVFCTERKWYSNAGRHEKRRNNIFQRWQWQHVQMKENSSSVIEHWQWAKENQV